MGKQQGRKVSIDLRKSLAAVLALQTEPAESPGSFLYWNAISAVIEWWGFSTGCCQMSLLLAAGDSIESAIDHEVPVDPNWSSESLVAYWFPGFAVASREAVSSRRVFGIAPTLVSSEISRLGSLCWTGLVKALESTRARRKMRETEVIMNSLAWEREELRKSGLQLRTTITTENNSRNKIDLSIAMRHILICTRFNTRRADRQHDAAWHYGALCCRNLFRVESSICIWLAIAQKSQEIPSILFCINASPLHF